MLGSHEQLGGPYPTLPIAYSQGAGRFLEVQMTSSEAQLTAMLGFMQDIRPVAADVNNDSRSDLTMTGGVNFVGVALNTANDVYTFTDKYIP